MVVAPSLEAVRSPGKTRHGRCAVAYGEVGPIANGLCGSAAANLAESDVGRKHWSLGWASNPHLPITNRALYPLELPRPYLAATLENARAKVPAIPTPLDPQLLEGLASNGEPLHYRGKLTRD